MIYFRTFCRKRKYALGKTGKANIEKNLQELGLKLNAEDLKLVTQRIIELEIKKKPLLGKIYLISDVLIVMKKKIIVESYVLSHARV
jgi:D-citramalate synthase